MPKDIKTPVPLLLDAAPESIKTPVLSLQYTAPEGTKTPLPLLSDEAPIKTPALLQGNKHYEYNPLYKLNGELNIFLKSATTAKNMHDFWYHQSQDNLKILAKNTLVLAAMAQGIAAWCAAAELAGKALGNTINYFEGKYEWSDFVKDLPAASISVMVIIASSSFPTEAALLHTTYLAYEACHAWELCPDLNSWIMGDDNNSSLS